MDLEITSDVWLCCFIRVIYLTAILRNVILILLVGSHIVFTRSENLVSILAATYNISIEK